jgi:hypothetical protein
MKAISAHREEALVNEERKQLILTMAKNISSETFQPTPNNLTYDHSDKDMMDL